MWLALADNFLLVFHLALVAFSMFGWMWKKTRKANLAVLITIAFSWFGLGIWYGFGYCPCTDLHWQVKREPGQNVLPYSYIKYLADTVTGMDLNARLLDALTAVFYFAALFLSAVLNYRDRKKEKPAEKAGNGG